MDCIKDLQDAIRNILVNNGLCGCVFGKPDEPDTSMLISAWPLTGTMHLYEVSGNSKI